MNNLQTSLESVVLSVWQCTLGLTPAPRGTSTPPADASPLALASVKLDGAWAGTLRLSCPPSAARRAAGIMLGRSAEDVSAEDALDALRELAHVVGGNLSPILPQPISLSMPTALEIPAVPPDEGEEVARYAFEVEGHPLLVRLVASPLPAREGGAR